MGKSFDWLCQWVGNSHLCQVMRIHRIMAEAAFALLAEVLERGQVADRVLARVCAQHPRWGKRDRAFLAETLFEVLRWRRALEFVAGSDSIPDLCAAQWRRMDAVLPDWLGISRERVAEMAVRESCLGDQPRAVRESVPQWLDACGVDELGDLWEVELMALNRRAPVFLRVNSLRATVGEVCDWLAAHGIEAERVESVPGALRLPLGRALPKAMAMDGRIEIQDAGSQCIVPWLDPRPGESVLDACAGAGGKSLQIAAAMGNQGRLVAMDVVVSRLEELKRRAERAAVVGIQTRLAAPDSMPGDLLGRFDRVLIDSPCSGLGTLRRQPDLKWRLKPSFLHRIRTTQAEILCRYAQAVRPGGVVVYATCSILPSENHLLVRSFCEESGFSLIGERSISPAETGFDGFYAALMRRPNA